MTRLPDCPTESKPGQPLNDHCSSSLTARPVRQPPPPTVSPRGVSWGWDHPRFSQKPSPPVPWQLAQLQGPRVRPKPSGLCGSPRGRPRCHLAVTWFSMPACSRAMLLESPSTCATSSSALCMLGRNSSYFLLIMLQTSP